jgi:hypothetical protein
MRTLANSTFLSNVGPNANVECFRGKNEHLVVQSNTWWTFPKMWDQMNKTTSLSHLLYGVNREK